jgi:predicted ATPase/DNA-binding SARP family transcriptional activator
MATKEYAPAVDVRVLGPVELLTGTGRTITVPGTKMRGLVAVLALDAGATVAPRRLIEALWGDQDVSGPNAVQVAVSRLRRVLADAGEAECVVTRPTGYRLEVDPDAVDALRFESLVDRARRADDDPATVVELLSEALALWRGVPLEGAPDTEVVVALRARLEELHRDTVEERAEAGLALGHHGRLVPEIDAMVAAEPLRERRWGQLIRALYGSGRQADALRAYTRAREVLIEAVGVEPSAELRELEAAVLAQDGARLGVPGAPAAVTPVGDGFRRRGNVRHAVVPCIGREDELEALADLTGRHRLVTLVGPGGVGKTRLAQEVAGSLQDAVADGAWWVELASARDEVGVLAAIQRSLGMDAGGVTDADAALAAVARALGDRAAVLVLDNCEHLLGALAPVVAELLGRCGRLQVVATSREGLGIAGEVLFPVGPLAPDAAVALFEARTVGTVGVDAEAAEAIAAICERLDRLPLALELAAARTRHLRVDEILDRLSDRFDLLRLGPRTAEAHQRNLEAVAAWSYDLLDDAERVVFERLAVFSDGATLDAAEHVAAAHGVTAADVEPVLHRLIDKSLVVADRSGPGTRFRMLQTLADFAGSRLDARGDRDAAQRRHAQWVQALAHRVRWGARTTGATVAAVQDEDAAIRDAIGWALVADPVLALEVCDDLSGYWFGSMRVSVGWELLLAALAAAGDEDPRRRASASAWAVVFATMVQDIETADRYAEEALAFERELGDPARLGRICFAIALAQGYRSDGDAGDWAVDARRWFTLAGMTVGLGHASFAAGAVQMVAGDIGGAASNLLDAIAVFRREQDHLGLVLAVSRLGELAWRRGDLALYARMHAELLELGRAGRSAGVVTGATARLAHAHLVNGDLEEAQRLARAALAMSGESFMPVINGYAFRSAGLVDVAGGHAAEGRAQLAAAIEAFELGTGTIGLGQAALCWVDLSRSYLGSGDADAARRAAETAVEVAIATGDPWVRAQADAHLAAGLRAAPPPVDAARP